jgi:hypothetical protein
MQTVIVLSSFAVLLAYLSKYKNAKFLFEIAFLVIFILTAFRFNFGTDYPSYYQDFVSISKYSSLKDIVFELYSSEPAWVVLNFIFKPIGFFGFIIVLTAFLCYTYYSLIKKYVPPNYYWFAIFIFTFSSDIMWIQFSALRQALSIAIFVHSVKYLSEKNRPVLYVLLNLLGGLFHSSAYFMIPLVVFSHKKIRNSKIVGILIITVFWALLLVGEKYLNQMAMLTELLTGERYTNRLERETTSSTTLIGSFVWSSILMIVIYYVRKQSENVKNVFYLTSLHSMVYVLSPLIFLSGRMGYYFAVFSVITYPLILQSERNKIIKFGIYVIYIIFIIYRLFNFFELEWVVNGYSDYKTIFTHSM